MKEGNDIHAKVKESEHLKFPHTTNSNRKVQFKEELYHQDKEDDIDKLLNSTENANATEAQIDHCYQVLHHALVIEIKEDIKATQLPVHMFTPEPSSIYAVLKLPDELRRQWINATGTELETVIINVTFDLDSMPREGE